MKITAEQLHAKWSAVNYYDHGYIQVETEHPLEWYVGYKGIDQKTLLMITYYEPELLPTSKSIVVSKGFRPDGRWALSFDLMRREQESVFETLCADIIVYTQSANSEAVAVQLTSKRYRQWNRLLEYQRKALMDESRRKGLLGELIFLHEIIIGGCPIETALRGWVGPDGADQDFVYADKWYEIKSVGASADSISISSLEQLSNPDIGELVVMRIDKCAPEKNGAVTLGEQADCLFNFAKDEPDVYALLESKLARYGYIDIPEYREQKYNYSGKLRFRVDASFPKLTSDLVVPQIISAQYSISLASIDVWRLEESINGCAGI